MEFIETLNELATRIGLGKVELDEAGGVMLLFDGECGISFVPDAAENVVYFQCEIADVPHLADGDFRRLLEVTRTVSGCSRRRWRHFRTSSSPPSSRSSTRPRWTCSRPP